MPTQPINYNEMSPQRPTPNSPAVGYTLVGNQPVPTAVDMPENSPEEIARVMMQRDKLQPPTRTHINQTPLLWISLVTGIVLIFLISHHVLSYLEKKRRGK